MEYSITDTDRSSNIDLLEAAMKKGLVFAVDATFPADISFSLVDSTSNNTVFTSEKNTLSLRFETDHFTRATRDSATWRVADLENYLASKLYDEFYRGLGDQ